MAFCDMNKYKNSTAESDAIDRVRRNIMLSGISAGLLWPVAAGGVGSLLLGDNLISASTWATIRSLADTIIPAGESPSATDVGAEVFALNVVYEARSEEFQQRFFAGLAQTSQNFQSRHLSAFEHASQQVRECYVQNALTGPDPEEAWFLQRFRQYLVVGWVLCEQVASGVFAYQHALGSYQPNTDNPNILLASNLDRLYIE